MFIQESWVKVLLDSYLLGGSFDSVFSYCQVTLKITSGSSQIHKREYQRKHFGSIDTSENNVYIWESLYIYTIHFILYFAFIDLFIVCSNRLHWGELRGTDGLEEDSWSGTSYKDLQNNSADWGNSDHRMRCQLYKHDILFLEFVWWKKKSDVLPQICETGIWSVFMCLSGEELM